MIKVLYQLLRFQLNRNFVFLFFLHAIFQTDVCGIRWKRLSIEPQPTPLDPLDDPVIRAYARCLQNDILCVWKRVVKHSEQRPTDISFGKELWIFWYGDKPSVLDEIITSELKGMLSQNTNLHVYIIEVV